MIRLIKADEETASLLPYLEQDALGCRMASALLCYQGTPFLDAWVQEDAFGIQAVLCRLDGAMTILDTGKADLQEQRAFCHAVGFSSLTASPCVVAGLGLTPSSSGIVMKLCPLPHKPNGHRGHPTQTELSSLCSPTICWGGSPRLYYPILEQCRGDGIHLPPFDTWYVDCSHRMRRGWMRGAIARQSEGNSGCILAVETPHAALISGVAVLPSFRNKGIGKRMVEALTSTILAEGKACFLLCLGPLVDFYRSLGFEVSGQWAVASPSSKEVSL